MKKVKGRKLRFLQWLRTAIREKWCAWIKGLDKPKGKNSPRRKRNENGQYKKTRWGSWGGRKPQGVVLRTGREGEQDIGRALFKKVIKRVVSCNGVREGRDPPQRGRGMRQKMPGTYRKQKYAKT